ncbi:MAG: DUF3122 domain-containing protein [Cyanobacteria bacterium]|jgi:hypothetical protein|nr:DUF3122 domain-containing protein [Cyanobacteria bacterium GSL.Bin1]
MNYLLRQLILGITLIAVVLGLNGIFSQPAHAEIRKLQEDENQVVYQSRQKLFDRYDQTWQAIAFKRITADGANPFTIRLSGFPGTTEIAHSQPLTVRTPTGETFYAEDISEEAFVDQAPAGNIGQYDLESIISQLPTELEIIFSLPTQDEKQIQLAVSPLSIQEWKTVAAKES